MSKLDIIRAWKDEEYFNRLLTIYVVVATHIIIVALRYPLKCRAE